MKHIVPIALFTLGLALAQSACSTGKHAEAGASHDGKTLAVGSDVPPLVRVDQRGQVVSLRAAEPTILYFYPKDGTPGCTKEACAFRDAWDRYRVAGVRVIGVSTDDDAAHREFAKEHALQFSLIADPEQVWSKAFGVGSFMGLDARMSFLIGKDDKIAKVYEDVDPAIHADEVLKDAATLGFVQ